MPYKIDFDELGATEWHLTADGAEPVHNPDYAPTVYVAGPDRALDDLADALATDPKVASLADDRRLLDLGATDRERVLRVDLERVREVAALAREIRGVHEPDRGLAPGTFRLFNVDLSPQFRYCLETGADPRPGRELRTAALDVPEDALADGRVERVRLDGERLGDAPEPVLRRLDAFLDRVDPDVLVLQTGALVPALCDAAADRGIEGFALGRRPGYDQLAGANTYESYGRVGHSPARYDVPGRVLVARDNSFLWSKGHLSGLLELVRWSHRPLQETAWASIGTSFTAMQTHEALSRGVLVPWNKWAGERYKSVGTLHDADRGGHTFAPEVGLHEDVVEIDFASLYPNIMVERNVSPETVQCDCDGEHDTVPELGYDICRERDGFLGDVLGDLVERRAGLKAELAGGDLPDARRRDRERRSEALKWVLVTCFGYQGYRNAKFGRIECHEAINAYARQILLDAKETLEAEGWEILHGIVDSLWVTPRTTREEATPIEAVCETVTADAEIELEREADYEWLCLVPRRGHEQAGALTKYFGRVAGSDETKYRGIECRQHSTPAFVAACQREFVDVLGRERAPEPVVDRLVRRCEDLRAGRVDPADLAIEQRVSKSLEGYTQATLAAAALERYAAHGVEKHPGESIAYVVADDGAAHEPERVRLHFEDDETYDPAFYRDLLVRACESVVSPLGWDREDVERAMRDTRDLTLDTFE